MPVRIESRRYDDPDVTIMVAEVQAEYVGMYGGPDKAVIDPHEFVPPAGLLLVGYLDGDPVMTGGWRRTGQVAEIKRMYVRPSARRRGFARRMLAEIERTARQAGVERLILNTGPRQPAAIELYRRAGYEAVAPFGHYAALVGALFYGKSLSAVAGDRCAAEPSGEQ